MSSRPPAQVVPYCVARYLKQLVPFVLSAYSRTDLSKRCRFSALARTVACVPYGFSGARGGLGLSPALFTLRYSFTKLKRP